MCVYPTKNSGGEMTTPRFPMRAVVQTLLRRKSVRAVLVCIAVGLAAWLWLVGWERGSSVAGSAGVGATPCRADPTGASSREERAAILEALKTVQPRPDWIPDWSQVDIRSDLRTEATRACLL